MKTTHSSSRRDFLKKTAVLTGATVTGLSTLRVHAAESGQLKIGLLGCGGRGCGAVVDGLSHDPNVKLIAVADIFKDKAEGAVKMLKEKFKERIDVTPERIFTGFDAYKSVIPLADVVFLCTPQHFRPMTLKAAIEAGKHVFCEKPVAVDATGIRSVLASATLAKEKGLNIVTGLINRYSPRVREAVKRIQDGQIGQVITARANRMGGPLWMRPRTEGDSEMVYQMRNWVNFNWLASEFINDVTIHQLDVALWCMGDERTPVNAFALGGRIARTQPDAGDMYDNMSVVYEYENGQPLYAFSRQIPGCYSNSSAHITGTKGGAEIGNVGWGTVKIYGDNPYDVPKDQGAIAYFHQHTTLYNAIRSGGKEYVNNLPYTAKATMAAILGRVAAYSGQKVTWEDAFNSTEDFSLKEYSWDATPPITPNEKGEYPLAIPGKR
ncbi:MAG: Gfo/Idh/MocA family oxidoreductase [Planctomycetaceae bacterium]|jgi:predicted dehydrogenase|nr:Gfo/Idh/MocA family oxidoreductase [Planctomycetaceae bacterium]